MEDIKGEIELQCMWLQLSHKKQLLYCVTSAKSHIAAWVICSYVQVSYRFHHVIRGCLSYKFKSMDIFG